MHTPPHKARQETDSVHSTIPQELPEQILPPELMLQVWLAMQPPLLFRQGLPEARTTRNPKSKYRSPGKPWLSREADRQFPATSCQPPPRTTRLEPVAGPCGSITRPLGKPLPSHTSEHH